MNYWHQHAVHLGNSSDGTLGGRNLKNCIEYIDAVLIEIKKKRPKKPNH